MAQHTRDYLVNAGTFQGEKVDEIAGKIKEFAATCGKIARNAEGNTFLMIKVDINIHTEHESDEED